MKKNCRNRGNASLPVILFIVFLVLKLTNVITWSWWWITSPLWISVGLILSIMFVVLLMGGSLLTLAALLGRKR